MALCSRSAAFSVVYVQQLGAHASCGFGVYEPHSSLRFRVPLGIGTIGRAACHLYAAAQSTFQTDLSPTLSIDNAWAVGFRFGEALHPGPVGLLAFPSPIPPSAPRTSPPASRVLPRDSRGCPPDQRRIDAFFGSNSDSMQPGAQELAEPRLPVVGSPDTSAFRLAIVNPTSLLHKESQLMDLASHVYVLSETSAVAAAIAENRFRKAGLSVTWGSPVPSHWRENAAGPSLRGYAAGVAIASLFPVRRPFAVMGSAGYDAHRLLVSHVRIGPMHARIVAVYGWPANHTGATAKNTRLFQEVACLAAESPLPTLIAGDFNTDVTKLPCWTAFQCQGYAELFDLSRRRFGKQLPATCRGSTRHDTALLPPVFQQMLRGAAVDTECHLFDSHSPVLLTFAMPQHNPCKQVWRKPASWSDYAPSAPEMEQHYLRTRDALHSRLDSCTSRDDLEQAFTSWASTVEEAVDQALRSGHARDPLRQPVPSLPKKARGRCTYRFVKSQPLHVASPAGRSGDYCPPDEALTVRSRLKVKQVRRLQAFHRHLSSARQAGSGCTATMARSLLQEWHAICVARRYPPSFEHWLLGIACFSEFYVDCSTTLLSHGPQVQLTLQSLPESSWLEDVLAYVRFDCEAVVRQEAEARKLFSKFCRNLDSATGLSHGYSGLRPKANPPFTAIPVDERQTATLTCCARDGWGLYRLPAAEFFRPACPAFADQSPAEIGSAQTDDVHGTRLWIRVPSRPLAQEFQLHQVTDAASPRELQRCFTDFWAPIWNRDKGASRSDLSYWKEFLSSLPECPQAAQGLCLPLDDINFWRAHLRGLKSKTSTGYCGFSNAELKWLPDAPLGDLVRLFHLCGVFGWPKHLGRASVATIAKIACPLGMHHGARSTSLPIFIGCGLLG